MCAYSFSVVICAYTEDRWDLTCAAVESVRSQSLPSDEIILVIDHNPALLERARTAFTDVLVQPSDEPKGLSGARNSGAARARGDIIAFLDDDAVAHADWLKFIADSYENPEILGVGSLILPCWETARPPWLPEEFYWAIGCNYAGMAPSGAPVRNLIGASMSFRREAFEFVPEGFSAKVGRRSIGWPLGCEETEFCIRLAQQAPDKALVTDHRAIAWHFVPASRCTVSYFVSRCFAEGLSKARVAASVGAGSGLSAERTFVRQALPAGAIRGVSELFHGDLAGAARVAVSATGLSAASLGYLCGKLFWRA